ncbi:hypothetical protein QBC43DRAFT_322878 [Cladorrhinum sp. PSN259]|nr:hypothetical protein QBC43DRAFT_322878 [Cladorrhinum sp. PSN259]
MMYFFFSFRRGTFPLTISQSNHHSLHRHSFTVWRGAFHRFRQRIRRTKSVPEATPGNTSSSDTAAFWQIQDAKERRRQNRDRYTDPAGPSPLLRSFSTARHASPGLIAMAGMMIAAGELDRLTFLADDIAKARQGGQGAVSPFSAITEEKIPPNTPMSNAGGVGGNPALSGTATPLGRFVPFPPSNTPVVGEGGSPPQISPIKQNSGKRAGPSRLSEMHTLESAKSLDECLDVLRLESYPEFAESEGGGENPGYFLSRTSTPKHQAGARYFAGSDMGSAGVASEGKLKGHDQCEDGDAGYLGDISRSTPEKERDTHATECKEEEWSAKYGEPGDSDIFCHRLMGEEGTEKDADDGAKPRVSFLKSETV